MNVLLDLDGTLTDPKKGITRCIRHALSALDTACPEDDVLQQYIGPPLHDTFRTLLATKDDFLVHKAVALYRERFADIGLFENAVYPGVPEALQQLQDSGASLFMATSKPQVFARRIAEYFGLDQYLDDIYGSELDGTRARKGDLIAYVLSSAKLKAQDAVMVGDRKHDAVGALKNKVFPVGVLWGYGTRTELQAAGVRRLLASPAELGKLIVGKRMQKAF